ncbi:SGNH/GDSL hydrolase family protein [Bacteriovorax sp. PP10]|uniref:SGNH/GDSL hydrolase family protein n=1 Tax=Bacteriovorax antarcticus TaxID=3088717 RepID=A0ABU5VZ69_9BACT|nr:SGNH/GDSL hydrolase family protein [Bacteriovorax sp. PP10]MEA9357320.1 SGNH/GDSL hydrolase family protein [Bacteriovorax sp. PP10]
MKITLLAILSMISTAALSAVNPTILYVGDSHSYGKLGVTIEKNLSTISDRIILEASCGATPSTWLGNNKFEKTVCGFWKKDGKEEVRSQEHQTPKFADELAKYRPDVTIVQLGTNIAVNAPKSATKSIVAMMNAIESEDSICIWIGPPDANSKVVTRERLKETNALLSELAKANKCFYIDSLKLTSFPANNKEGIHYPPSLSAEWGGKVSLELLKILGSDH